MRTSHNSTRVCLAPRGVSSQRPMRRRACRVHVDRGVSRAQVHHSPVQQGLHPTRPASAAPRSALIVRPEHSAPSVPPSPCGAPAGLDHATPLGDPLPSCIVCSPRGWSIETALRSCRAGSYSSAPRSDSCTLCESGYFQDTRGTTACAKCIPSSFCPVGATMELPANCAPGTYSNVSDSTGLPECFDCKLGQFCPGGAAPPSGCMPGRCKHRWTP